MVRHPYLAMIGLAFEQVAQFVTPDRYSERIERAFYRSKYWQFAVNGRRKP